jgi:hypothetical protein
MACRSPYFIVMLEEVGNTGHTRAAFSGSRERPAEKQKRIAVAHSHKMSHLQVSVFLISAEVTTLVQKNHLGHREACGCICKP